MAASPARWGPACSLCHPSKDFSRPDPGSRLSRQMTAKLTHRTPAADWVSKSVDLYCSQPPPLGTDPRPFLGWYPWSLRWMIRLASLSPPPPPCHRPGCFALQLAACHRKQKRSIPRGLDQWGSHIPWPCAPCSQNSHKPLFDFQQRRSIRRTAFYMLAPG